MTIKEIELIKKMLKKQAKLDKAIMEEYGLEELDEEKLSFAILDEVGELTHELKGNWCWWKKTQPQVDEEKVLGELVDIWHFVLSWQNNHNGGEEGLLTDDELMEKVDDNRWSIEKYGKGIVIKLADLSYSSFYKVEPLIAITEYLGFTIEQVYVDVTINYNNELLSTVSGNPCELLKDLENDELKKEIHGINALDEDYLEIYLLV